ncbi:PepSY-associated TM helix domain-containing protein [Ferruginibacter paludis]|uniref:PepSY-associated TM helix domain-containing protein n=1 Tax=Ferruginibacter paludis TaxID=1310417 RepID=UPI0025B3E058|nr:PepSY-associated TM helix domain-containing protein [Ferruginibacter paludis]MDN3654078.1 PepSY-associated TM helix domain-containing protein [Ferruginibacter paludis]
MKKYYPPVRTLHLYIGLFVSPFVLIFSISVLVLNHAGYLNSVMPVKRLPVIKSHLDKIPYDASDLQTAKAITQKLGINGEIDFISQNDDHISFPVTLPGERTKIEVNKHTNDVLITRDEEGVFRATNYLHKMPGPHNTTIRGNTVFMKTWRLLADMVVYLLLFLSASGIFLWYFLKAERKLGWLAIISGAIIFTGLLLFIIG